MLNDTKTSYFQQRSDQKDERQETENFLNMSHMLSSDKENHFLAGSKSQ